MTEMLCVVRQQRRPQWPMVGRLPSNVCAKIDEGPRRVRQHPRGVADWLGVDMTERTCVVDGCEKQRRPGRQGMCSMHESRWYKHRDLHTTPRGTLEERFARRAPQGSPDECWVWPHAKNDHGYGQIWDGKRVVYAHRVSYERHYGPIPPGVELLHRCDNPPCINPHHLRAGTHLDNVADMVAKGRQATNERAGMTRLADTVIREVRRRVLAGELRSRVADDLGIDWSHVSKIMNGKRRRGVA